MSLLCRHFVVTLTIPRSIELCYAICAKGKGGHQNRMRVIHKKGDFIMASFTGKVVGGTIKRYLMIDYRVAFNHRMQLHFVTEILMSLIL